jgi:hypothetical protein
MKVIEPTPSQAVSVLKRYFQSLGHSVSQSQVQEGYARSRGYATWQAFVSENDPRGRRAQRGERSSVPAAPVECVCCRQCGSELDENGWCVDQTCVYSDWPQQVERADMEAYSTAELEMKYQVAKRPHEYDEEVSQRWLIEDWLAEVADIVAAKQDSRGEALGRISGEFYDAMTANGLMKGYEHQSGRGEEVFEGEKPFVQVSFTKSLGERFALELILTLRDGKFAIYIDTWEFRRPGQNYLVEDLQDMLEAEPDETFRRFIERGQAAVRRAFNALAERYNIQWQ